MSRYYQTSQSNPLDYGYELPFDEMMQALAAKTTMQDQALAGVNVLGKLENVRAQDKPVLQEFSKYLNENINKLSSTDLTSGEGRRAYMDFNKKVREATGPTGLVGAMYSNYKAEQDFIKSIKENKTMAANRKDKIINKYTSQPGTYKGEFDLNQLSGGQYSGFKAYNPVDNVDITKAIDDYVEKTKASEFTTEYDKNTGAVIYRHKKSGEQVTPERIFDIAMKKAMNDPAMMAYYREGVEIGEYKDSPFYIPTVDANGNETFVPNPNNIIVANALAVADKYSYNKTLDSRTERYDDIYFHRVKNQIDTYTPTVLVGTNSTEVKPPETVSEIQDMVAGTVNRLSSEADKLNQAGANVYVPKTIQEAEQLRDQLNSIMETTGVDEFKTFTNDLNNLILDLQAADKFKRTKPVVDTTPLMNNDLDAKIYKWRIGDEYGEDLTPLELAKKLKNINSKSTKKFDSNSAEARLVDLYDGYLKESIEKNPTNKTNLKPKSIPNSLTSTPLIQNERAELNTELSQSIHKGVQSLFTQGTLPNIPLFNEQLAEADDEGNIKDVVKDYNLNIGPNKTAKISYHTIPMSDGNVYGVVEGYNPTTKTKKNFYFNLSGVQDANTGMFVGDLIKNSPDAQADMAIAAIASRGLPEAKFGNITVEVDFKEDGSKGFLNNSNIIITMPNDKGVMTTYSGDKAKVKFREIAAQPNSPFPKWNGNK
jgi:hypothetical protein